MDVPQVYCPFFDISIVIEGDCHERAASIRSARVLDDGCEGVFFGHTILRSVKE